MDTALSTNVHQHEAPLTVRKINTTHSYCLPSNPRTCELLDIGTVHGFRTLLPKPKKTSSVFLASSTLRVEIGNDHGINVSRHHESFKRPKNSPCMSHHITKTNKPIHTAKTLVPACTPTPIRSCVCPSYAPVCECVRVCV